MGELSDLQIGQTVELSDGRAATVQYIGDTHFAAGDWVGVVLEDASGKNNGEIQGQRYFDCPNSHGMFVRPAAVTIVNQPVPKLAARLNGKANGAVPKSRPSSMLVSGTKRQSILDPVASKRQSINASSPTPGSRVSRLASPSKSPTKQLGSTASSGTSSRNGTPAPPLRKPTAPLTKTNRTSMGPPPLVSATSRAARPSIAGNLKGPSQQPSQTSALLRTHSNRVSLRPRLKELIKSPSGDSKVSISSGPHSSDEGLDPALLSPTAETQNDGSTSPVPSTSNISRPSSEKPMLSRGRSPPAASQRSAANTAASNREIEDLKIKLRLIEKKRLEDREKLKAMDKLQTDKNKYEGIIQKLQAKYQPQHQELADLRKQIKAEEEKIQALESQLAEHDTMMEVTTLDREMAEETAESVKLELDALRQKFEEIELEVQVLREENDELGKEISPEEKTSQGWLQLERSNERLREALMRLRDVTQDQESNFKDQIAELEADVQDLTKTKENYGLAKERLELSNAVVDDLRQQLDTALGAEEMIEELTEKHMALSEKMEEMKLTIEDLESLKELNDELEINHTETEKQLQEEIDYNGTLLMEEARKAAAQDGTIQDLEYTVTRFKDLVTNMQSDLEDLRASKEITESEANELSSRSRALMDLNMRLQTSASKAQFKAIDLELGKLEAQESLEHLSIVQFFLPDSFRSEQDSVQALLRFRRIGFKAHLMHNLIKERLNGSTVPSNDDDFTTSADALDKLIWVSSTCDRFINNIQTCDMEAFRRLGGASYELEPVERAFNGWIEGFKKNEIKMTQCGEDLQRSISLINHLAEIHILDDLEHFPDRILTQAAVMQSHLETAALTLAHVKNNLESSAPEADAEVVDGDEEHAAIFERIDALISSSRSAKVISSKAIRQLEDLKSRSLTLEPSTLNVVEQTQECISGFSASIRAFTQSVINAINTEGREDNAGMSRISQALSSSKISIPSLTFKLHSTTSHLQTFYNLTNSLTQTVEYPSPPPPPPWKLLAQRIRDETADQAARETELGRLKDDISEKNTTLAIKDKMLEELSVKTEVLEKRVGESGGRREKVRELEVASEAAKAKEKDYVGKLTHLRHELEKLELERDAWKKGAQIQALSSQPGQNPVAPTDASMSVASLGQIEHLKAEIAAHQSAIRYLRASQRQTFLSTSQAYLSTPLVPKQPTVTPLQREGKDVLHEMLHLISQPARQPIKLRVQPKEDRLRWRPAKETSRWQVQRQREEWEEWREWRDYVARRLGSERREEGRRREGRVQGRRPGMGVSE